MERTPVGLGRDGNIGEGPGVLAGVDATEGDGGASAAGGGVHVDGEEVLLDEALRPHQIEGRGDVVGSNAGVGQTEDTVHGLTVEEVRQGGRLAESGLLDAQTCHRDVINVQDTVHGTSSVADLDGPSVRLVRR